MPRRYYHRRRQRTGALFMALLATVMGVGLAGVGALRYRDAQAKPPAAPETTATPTTNAEPREITILGAGDIITHPQIWQQADADAKTGRYDFAPIFEKVTEPISAADLALCHFDMPVASATATPLGFPLFNAPPEVLDGIKKAGFDGCSTAGNHALDRGVEGVTRALDAMDKIGLGHSGTARSADEAASVKIYDVKGVKVAHLSYSYSFGVKRPTGKEWSGNQIDSAAIKAAAKKARDAKADIVVLSLHWGKEYQHEPTEEQESMARDLLGTPEIDFIFGHHSHSVQVIEKVGQKWAAYGLGNQVARHSENLDKSREGIMAVMTLTESAPGSWSVTKAEAIPTWTELTPKVRIVDLAAAAVDQSLTSSARRGYQTTLNRIRGYLMLRGNTGGVVIAGAAPAPSGSPSPTPRP